MSDGGIQLEMHIGGVEFELVIGPNGTPVSNIFSIVKRDLIMDEDQ